MPFSSRIQASTGAMTPRKPTARLKNTPPLPSRPGSLSWPTMISRIMWALAGPNGLQVMESRPSRVRKFQTNTSSSRP